MKKQIFLLIPFWLCVSALFAQSGNIGVGTATPTSKLHVNGSVAYGYRTFTNSTTLDGNDYTVEYSGTTATTVTLPNATICAGRVYQIKNISTNVPAPVVTISAVSSQTIDNKPNWLLDTKNELVEIVSNGTNWTIYGQQVPNPKSDSTGGAWNEGGNTDVSTSTKKFGTLTNNDIPFITNSIERARLTKTGNMGIGTTTPSTKLEVASGVSNTSGLKFTNLNNSSPTTSSTAVLGVDASGNVVVSTASSAVFTGATSSTAGTIGMVPAPAAGNQNKFLTGSGGWASSFPLITANGTSTATTETRDPNAWVTKGTGFYVTDVAAALTNPIPNEGAWFEFSQAANSGGYFGQTCLNDHNFYYRGGTVAGLVSTVWQKMLSIPATSQTKVTIDASNNATFNVVDNSSLIIATNNTERIKVDSVGKVRVGASNTIFDASNPEKFLINCGNTTSDNAIVATGTYNHWLQLNINNKSNGVQASSDLVATADNGTDTTNFIDLGMNSSGYVAATGNPIETGKANDGYLMSYGNDFYLVNASPAKDILFLTGGGASANERVRITSTGSVGIGTSTPAAKLDMSGNFKLGTSGTVLSNIIKTSISVSDATTFAYTSTRQITATVSGATANATVILNPRSALPTGISIGWVMVSSANTITIGFTNSDATARAVGNITFDVTVIQ